MLSESINQSYSDKNRLVMGATWLFTFEMGFVGLQGEGYTVEFAYVVAWSVAWYVTVQ